MPVAVPPRPKRLEPAAALLRRVIGSGWCILLFCVSVRSLHAQDYRVPSPLFPIEPKALLGADDDAVFYLHFSPQVLSDTELSELVPLIASTAPTSKWLSVEKKPDDTIASIIDRYYDYFAKDDRGCTGTWKCFPETTEALEALIDDTNPAFAQRQHVQIPLVPARGRTNYNPLESYRVLFDPIRATYFDLDRFSPTGFALIAQMY